jgi:hypothetical protein
VPSTLRLRATRLWEHAEREVRRVVIARGRAREVLERDDRGLTIVEPLRVRADRDRSERLTRALARLDVTRFVAESASSEHGLAAPRFVIEVTLDPEEGEPIAKTVRVGAATDGGAFGQVEGDAVVVVLPEELVGELTDTFVDRSFLATPLREVESVRVVLDGRERTLAWNGTVFSEGGEPLERGLSERLASAIEGLRATRVGPYGPAAVADGLAPPRARVLVTRGAGAEPRELEVRIGAPTGVESTAHVRRADLEVGATVAESALAPFFEL